MSTLMIKSDEPLWIYAAHRIMPRFLNTIGVDPLTWLFGCNDNKIVLLRLASEAGYYADVQNLLMDLNYEFEWCEITILGAARGNHPDLAFSIFSNLKHDDSYPISKGILIKATREGRMFEAFEEYFRHERAEFLLRDAAQNGNADQVRKAYAMGARKLAAASHRAMLSNQLQILDVLHELGGMSPDEAIAYSEDIFTRQVRPSSLMFNPITTYQSGVPNEGASNASIGGNTGNTGKKRKDESEPLEVKRMS